MAPKNQRDFRPLPDGELARLRATLAQRQEYIAVLEVELFNTRAELNRFTQLYNQRITPLQQRANRLRKTLYETLEKQRLDETPPPPPFTPKNGRDGDREQTEPRPRGAKKRASRKKEAPEPEPKRLDPKLEERIKTLFRLLAKRFHPDLTADPEEKLWRQEVMAQVNLAFSMRNLDALLALAEQPDRNGRPANQSRAEEIAYLRTEIERLDKVIVDIEATLKQIELSSAMQLSLEVDLARRRGGDLLSDMAHDLTVQIEELEEHLMALGVDAQAAAVA